MKIRHLNLFESDGVSIDAQTIAIIKEKCSKFIAANKDMLNSHIVLYRGSEDFNVISPGNYKICSVRKDRRPRDSSAFLHKLINSALKYFDGINWRESTVFCTPDYDTAKNYGTVSVILPVGDYKLLYSEQIEDLIDMTYIATLNRYRDYHDRNEKIDGMLEKLASKLYDECIKILDGFAEIVHEKYPRYDVTFDLERPKYMDPSFRVILRRLADSYNVSKVTMDGDMIDSVEPRSEVDNTLSYSYWINRGDVDLDELEARDVLVSQLNELVDSTKIKTLYVESYQEMLAYVLSQSYKVTDKMTKMYVEHMMHCDEYLAVRLPIGSIDARAMVNKLCDALIDKER